MCKPGNNPENIITHHPPFNKQFRKFKELDNLKENAEKISIIEVILFIKKVNNI